MTKKPFSLENLPKGCSKETAEEINIWVTKCWGAHWKEYGPSSNYRTTFLNYALRDYKELDEAEMTRIYNAVVAQTKYFKLKASAGEWVKGKGLGVWYNQGIYNEEFIDESAADIAERREKKHCQCGQPVEVRTECMKCYSKRTEDKHKLASVLNSLGLYSPGQSLQEISQNCREYLLANPTSKLPSQVQASLEKGQEPGNQ